MAECLYPEVTQGREVQVLGEVDYSTFIPGLRTCPLRGPGGYLGPCAECKLYLYALAMKKSVDEKG